MWDRTRQTAFLQAQTHMLSVCGPSGVVYRADKTPFVQDGFRTCVTHQSEEGRCSSLDYSPSEPNCESSRLGIELKRTANIQKANSYRIFTHNISVLALLTEITNYTFFFFPNSVNNDKYWLMQQVYEQYKAHFSHTSNL